MRLGELFLNSLLNDAKRVARISGFNGLGDSEIALVKASDNLRHIPISK